jgi:hypothetical protein
MSPARSPQAQPLMPGTSMGRAMSRVVAEIQDGLRHGYFEYTLTCEIIGRDRRRLTLRAGKSPQFLIPKEDCVRGVEPSDSHDGSGDTDE